MRRAVIFATMLLAACGGEAEDDAGSGALLSSGQFELPAAQAFGESGFHEVLEIEGRLSGRAKGDTLVVALRDASRPGQTCDSEHPLSGCATVDWSDDASRPSVPPVGVFDNSLRLEVESGPRTFYLGESGALADQPDPFRPG